MPINYNKAEFIRSAGPSRCLYPGRRPQVTFAGRSNVGKSSVINRLLNRKNFARVGATPGKTHPGELLSHRQPRLSDGPARLRLRQGQQGGAGTLGTADGVVFPGARAHHPGVLIVDARHKPTADDVTMFQWFRGTGCPVVVVANKLDKLKKSEIYPNPAGDPGHSGAFRAGLPVPFSA